jgi:hypothetical protein
MEKTKITGRHSNCRKKEVMCRHREKYGAIQQRGKGKWRFVIPQGEAIYTGMLDCFVPYNDDNLPAAPSLRTQ